MEQLLAPLRAAGDPTRLRLLAVLARAELTVTELTQVLGQSQPRLSRHLKLLVSAGLLNRFQEGSWVFFRPAEKKPHLVGSLRTILQRAGLSEQEVRTLRGVIAALEKRPTRPRILPDGTVTTERGRFE